MIAIAVKGMKSKVLIRLNHSGVELSMVGASTGYGLGARLDCPDRIQTIRD